MRTGETFFRAGRTWVVQEVNLRGRPLSIRSEDPPHPRTVHFGSAQAWREWWDSVMWRART